MIRRAILHALAVGIAAGDDDAARAALSGVDVAIRGRARRGLERALIDAQLATIDQSNIPDQRHVMRVAALTIAKRPADPADVAETAAAYARLATTSPPLRGVANAIALVAVLALAGGAAMAAVALSPRSASKTYARHLPPPAAGAFEHGGQPLADDALAALLTGDLTDLVVAADHDRENGGVRGDDRKQRIAALRKAPAIVAHGPALERAWGDMLDAVERWVYVPTSGHGFDEVAIAFRDQVRAVSEQLAAAGLAYYLEGDILTSGRNAHAIIHSYRVENVAFVTAGSGDAAQPRRVLELRRIDQINFAHTLLGMQSEDLGDPVLLLDQIEDHVTRETLPVMADAAPFALGDDAWGGSSRATALRATVGVIVRAELAAALGAGDADAAAQIATLLASRARIIDSWRDDLIAHDIRLARTNGLFLPDTYLDDLDGIITATDLERVRAIEDELARLEAARIASRLQELVARTVRRHEVQHGLDSDRHPPPYPAALRDDIGDPDDRLGKPRDYAEHCRAELSAYASQIANDPLTPEMSYWHVASFAFDTHALRTPESYAGLIITEGIARHLGATTDGPVIHDGQLDRGRLADLATAITAAPPAALRDAARATWRDLYDEDLTPITDRRDER